MHFPQLGAHEEKGLSTNIKKQITYGALGSDVDGEQHQKPPFLFRRLFLCGILILVLSGLAVVGVVYSTSAQVNDSLTRANKKNKNSKKTTAIEITPFSSPYMNANDTPLTKLENGAIVGEDTAAYFNLDVNSPERASYDTDYVKNVSTGVWSIGSKSIVNVNVVEGINGLIVVDTGDSYKEGTHFYSLLRNVTQTPIRAIIYSHEHYVKGAQAFLDAEKKLFDNTDIMIIGHPKTNDAMARTGGLAALYPEIASVLLARSTEQFNAYLPEQGDDAGFKNTIKLGKNGFVPVNTPVEHKTSLTVAGMKLDFYTEGIGTDTANQVLVWIPEKKIILNNVLWGWYPNLYSARGGKFRDPTEWLQAVDLMRGLNAEIVLSTHSVPVIGAKLVKEKLLNYRDGIAYVRDQTLKGILLGEGPNELRYSVKLPRRLKNEPYLIQNYGEIASMTARIFVATFGQYDRDAASLNQLHPKEEAQRMVLAMGGEEATREKAQKAFNDGDFLWSCKLASYLVKANDVAENRQMKANCLRQMGYRALSTNTRSWYIGQALQLEGKVRILEKTPATLKSIQTNTADYVSHYRVRINGVRSNGVDKLMGIQFPGKPRYGLHIRQGVVEFVGDLTNYGRSTDVVVSLLPRVWWIVYNNIADPATLVDAGKIKVIQGDPQDVKNLFALFDPIYFTK